MARTHYHLVVSTTQREYAFVARTKAVAKRWMRHFKRYSHNITSLDLGACQGESCVGLAWDTLL
jgi:hypothetical protein